MLLILHHNIFHNEINILLLVGKIIQFCFRSSFVFCIWLFGIYQKQHCNFVNKKKLEAREQYLSGLDDTCHAVRWPKPYFQDDDRCVSASPPCLSDVCGLLFLFFFPLSYLIFMPTLKNSNQTPRFVVLKTLSISFLFRIIYEIKDNFNFIINRFFMLDLVLIFFITIYFILNDF